MLFLRAFYVAYFIFAGRKPKFCSSSSCAKFIEKKKFTISLHVINNAMVLDVPAKEPMTINVYVFLHFEKAVWSSVFIIIKYFQLSLIKGVFSFSIFLMN